MGQLLCNGLSDEADRTSRDSLLQILLDRFHDVNAYTRNHVLKTWVLLARWLMLLFESYWLCASFLYLLVFFSSFTLLYYFVFILTSSNKKIPLKWYLIVTEHATGRLQDKTQQARKNALSLLVQLLICNPYSPQLRYSSMKQSVEPAQRALEVCGVALCYRRTCDGGSGLGHADDVGIDWTEN